MRRGGRNPAYRTKLTKISLRGPKAPIMRNHLLRGKEVHELMSFGITISSGKTGQGGTNAGWRRIKEISAWACECGRVNAKHWGRCPDCHRERP